MAQLAVRPVIRQRSYVFTFSGIVVMLLTYLGFQRFYLAGEGPSGRKIATQILPLVIVHGTAMTFWMVLFLAQSLLIRIRKWKIHRKLGWVTVGVAATIAVTGPAVARESAKLAPTAPVFGMQNRQFLIVMLVEIAIFSSLVVAGILNRRRPALHRSMMLLATLSVLAGATGRIHWLFPVFGQGGVIGIFGPALTLGIIQILATFLLNGTVDKSFAIGLGAITALYAAAIKLAISDAGSKLINLILG